VRDWRRQVIEGNGRRKGDAMMERDETLAGAEDAIAWLRAGHREFVETMDEIERLAGREQGAPLDGAERETLHRLLRHLARAVPCHAAGERETLFPRLRAAFVNHHPSAILNLRTVEWEHVVAEAAHWLLEDLGEELVRQGRFATPTKRARFAKLVAVLGQLHREHRGLMEEDVLPLAVQVLTAPDLVAAGREMVERWTAARKEPYIRSGIR
jgi:hypothetical protein